MDEARLDRIRETWALAAADSRTTARAFYAELFRRAPETQALFRSDMDAQGEKLMGTLTFVVDHLEEENALLPAARDLAIRHVAYGVKPEHYGEVGAALLATFSTLLGSRFTQEDHDAWAAAYAFLAEYMIAQTA